MSARFLTSKSALCGAAAALLSMTSRSMAVMYDTGNTYHYQQTNFYCGPSSMEMMLDCPTVKNNPNVPAGVTNLLAGANDTVIQNNIYNAIHPLNATPAFGPGTDPVGYSAGVNNYDGPGTGSGHAYQWYGFANNFGAATLASKTVANAIADFNIPATVSVNYGGHWIDVSGVETSAAAGAGKSYTIKGFFVKDPWTGYVQNQVNLGNYKINSAGQAINKQNNTVVPWGLGQNTFLRYGYDTWSNGPQVTLANGTVKNVRVGGWFRYFTPGAYYTPGAPYNGQYIVEVDPQGPELPDDGSLGDGLPTPPPELSSSITATQADSYAGTDLSSDPTLSGELGFENGQIDPSPSDDMFLSYGDDTGGQGDWLVPYDGSGGINDITGYELIDAYTGVIDQATWEDPSNPLTLAEMDAMVSELESPTPLLVDDNTVPEPTTLSLLAIGSIGLLRRRRC